MAKRRSVAALKSPFSSRYSNIVKHIESDFYSYRQVDEMAEKYFQVNEEYNNLVEERELTLSHFRQMQEFLSQPSYQMDEEVLEETLDELGVNSISDGLYKISNLKSLSMLKDYHLMQELFHAMRTIAWNLWHFKQDIAHILPEDIVSSEVAIKSKRTKE